MNIVGILNITPDSFSDGGYYYNNEKALSQLKSLIHTGADIVDIGAAATNPNVQETSPEEEYKRLSTVLGKLIDTAHKMGAKVSLDSCEHHVIEFGIENGIDIINDVRGLQDEKIVEIANASKLPVIVTHSLTVPANSQVNIPTDADPILTVIDWAQTILNKIPEEQIIIDPGIGFAKNKAQNWKLIADIKRLQTLGMQICIGHSRKCFLADFDKNAATLAISVFLAMHNVGYIRVHDVQAHAQMLSNLEIQ